MAAGKHHAELIVPDLHIKGGCVGRLIFPQLQEVGEFRSKVAKLIVAPQKIDGPIAGHPHEPGRRIFGNTANWPHLQGSAKCVLDYVFGKIEVSETEYLSQ